MTRTERLLKLLQVLRSYRYPVSGQRLAERLDVSLRTIYRDIATLQAQGAQIEGEAGVGYVLKPGFFLPPLMFSQTEIEALLLGIQWVSQYGDKPLTQSAMDVASKITHVLPSNIKKEMHTLSLRVGPPMKEILAKEDLTSLREAIRGQKKIYIDYQSQKKARTQQIVWPFTIGYFTTGRILVGWCETKNDYDCFNTLGIISMKALDETYPRSRDSLFRDWQALQFSKLGIIRGKKN
jgi:predicted DNA-binding transcriptional regulator YafY